MASEQTTKCDLFIPHKDIDGDPRIRENFNAIQDWAAYYQKNCTCCGGTNTPFHDTFSKFGFSTTGIITQSQSVTFVVAASHNAQIQVVAHSAPALTGGTDILSAFFNVTAGPSMPTSTTPGTSTDATTTFTGVLAPGSYDITYGASGSTVDATAFTLTATLDVTYP